jgi:phosphoribosylanthranilate isomerase
MTNDLRPATLIKICGVRTPEHALVAAEAGADLVGLNFYPPSHRNVSVAEAAAVVRALRDHGHTTAAVGLFVNEVPARINSIAAEVGLDIVQLHGDERPGDLRAITLPVLRAIRLTPDESLPRVRERITANMVMAQGRPDGPLGQPLTPLLDAHASGLYGGTGVQADWPLAARLAVLWPLLLAGGLTPENVGDAVRAVQPLGVDVSSGVETNKVKDPAKICAFIAAVRAADSAPIAATTAATRPKQHTWRPAGAEESPA